SCFWYHYYSARGLRRIGSQVHRDSKAGSDNDENRYSVAVFLLFIHPFYMGVEWFCQLPATFSGDTTSSARRCSLFGRIAIPLGQRERKWRAQQCGTRVDQKCF